MSQSTSEEKTYLNNRKDNPEHLTEISWRQLLVVRDKIGSFKERADMQTWLNNWIGQYVENNPATATEADKARKPLAGAEVEVKEIEGDPGYYSSTFFLRPHYQLEGLTVSLRLVSKLPSGKK